jgi:Na+/H+ antiporter NhaC
LFVLWRSGKREAPADAAMFEVLAKADGYGAILQGAFTALLLAMTLALVTRALTLKQTTDAALRGMTIMFEALVVLVLAWSLSTAMKELNAPEYLVGALRTTLPAALLPTLTFVVGAIISFAVGSSYTTMGIMMPMVVPLSFELSPTDMMIPLASSGSVLAGACFGDHCSPISDTTVLSSIGSGSELLAHVRTQLPYALLIGVVSVVFGTLPAGYGANPWLCLLIAILVSFAALRFLGKPATVTEEAEPEPQPVDA